MNKKRYMVKNSKRNFDLWVLISSGDEPRNEIQDSKLKTRFCTAVLYLKYYNTISVVGNPVPDGTQIPESRFLYNSKTAFSFFYWGWRIRAELVVSSSSSSEVSKVILPYICVNIRRSWNHFAHSDLNLAPRLDSFNLPLLLFKNFLYETRCFAIKWAMHYDT